jgi:hypothetical protein
LRQGTGLIFVAEGYVLAYWRCRLARTAARHCHRKPDRNLRMKRTAKNANAWGFTAFG